MAVQIPRLDRFAPAAPTSQGQIEMRPLDVTRGVAQNAQQAGALINNVADQMARSENQQAELKATELSLKYEALYEEELKRVGSMQGDPTQAYIELDSKMQEQFAKLGEEIKDAIGPVQNIVNQKLEITRGRLATKRSISEGSQFRSYQRKVWDAEVSAISNQRVLDAISLDSLDEDAKKAGRFVNLEIAIQDIESTRDKQGRIEGLMVSGKNGEERSAILNDIINKDVSEAVTNVVKSLNLSGDSEAAEKVIEKYSDRLTAKARIDLLKGTKDAGKDKQAYAIEHDLRGYSPTEALQRAESKTKDPEVLNKVRKLVDERARINEQIRTRASNSAFEDIYNTIQAERSKNIERLNDPDNKKGLGPVSTMSRTWLEKSAIWGNVSGHLDAKDKEALYQMLEAPKQSTEEARIRMMKAATDGSMKKWSPQELEKNLNGMDGPDRNRYRNMWEKLKNEKTGQQTQYQANFMKKQLAHEMYQRKLISTMNEGSFRRKDSERFTEYWGGMLEAIDMMPPTSSTSDMLKYVKEYTEDRREDQPFRRTRNFNGGSPAGNALQKAQTDQVSRQSWIKEFMRVKGRPLGPNDKLDDFIKERNGKLGE